MTDTAAVTPEASDAPAVAPAPAATPEAPAFAGMTQQKYCSGCGTIIHKEAPQCPRCGAPQADVTSQGSKNRVLAIVLALLLGGLGVHKFYLGRIGQGILYVLFCWTFIPALIAFVEAIIYVTMSDQAFAKKYG